MKLYMVMGKILIASMLVLNLCIHVKVQVDPADCRIQGRAMFGSQDDIAPTAALPDGHEARGVARLRGQKPVQGHGSKESGADSHHSYSRKYLTFGEVYHVWLFGKVATGESENRDSGRHAEKKGPSRHPATLMGRLHLTLTVRADQHATIIRHPERKPS